MEKQPCDLKMVHVVCAAGSDRSRLIAEELNRRGYLATWGGVLRNHNYTTAEDLAGVEDVIFTTQQISDQFSRDRGLNKALKRNNAQKHVINITEQEKEVAFQSGDLSGLMADIKTKLDGLGFPDRNCYKIGRG